MDSLTGGGWGGLGRIDEQGRIDDITDTARNFALQLPWALLLVGWKLVCYPPEAGLRSLLPLLPVPLWLQVPTSVAQHWISAKNTLKSRDGWHIIVLITVWVKRWMQQSCFCKQIETEGSGVHLWGNGECDAALCNCVVFTVFFLTITINGELWRDLNQGEEPSSEVVLETWWSCVHTHGLHWVGVGLAHVIAVKLQHRSNFKLHRCMKNLEKNSGLTSLSILEIKSCNIHEIEHKHTHTQTHTNTFHRYNSCVCPDQQYFLHHKHLLTKSWMYKHTCFLAISICSWKLKTVISIAKTNQLQAKLDEYRSQTAKLFMGRLQN